MTRSELAARLLAKHPHLTARECDSVVSSILGRITDALVAGDRVELRGFAAFTLKETWARAGRNPKTGAAVDVEAKRAVVFKAGKGLRARLNSQDPETPDQIVAQTLEAE
ncbi:HU family DNA-binding protein [Methylobacterium sp. A54F]